MNMFGKFQLKITPGGAKTVTPIFVKIPKNGVSQNDEFLLSRNFSRRNVYLAKRTSLEDANSEKWRHESENSFRDSLSKMAKK